MREAAQHAGEGLRTSSIIELAEDNEIKIEGDTDEKKQCYFGRMCGGLFKETDRLLLDEIYMHRTIDKEMTDYGAYKDVKTYSFSVNGEDCADF